MYQVREGEAGLLHQVQGVGAGEGAGHHQDQVGVEEEGAGHHHLLGEEEVLLLQHQLPPWVV